MMMNFIIYWTVLCHIIISAYKDPKKSLRVLEKVQHSTVNQLKESKKYLRLPKHTTSKHTEKALPPADKHTNTGFYKVIIYE